MAKGWTTFPMKKARVTAMRYLVAIGGKESDFETFDLGEEIEHNDDNRAKVKKALDTLLVDIAKEANALEKDLGPSKVTFQTLSQTQKETILMIAEKSITDVDAKTAQALGIALTKIHNISRDSLIQGGYAKWQEMGLELNGQKVNKLVLTYKGKKMQKLIRPNGEDKPNRPSGVKRSILAAGLRDRVLEILKESGEPMDVWDISRKYYGHEPTQKEVDRVASGCGALFKIDRLLRPGRGVYQAHPVEAVLTPPEDIPAAVPKIELDQAGKNKIGVEIQDL